MVAIQEVGERCKEICVSTGIRMFHSCRDIYDIVCSEFTEFDKFWNKTVKPKSIELKDQAVATLADDTPLDPANERKRNNLMEFYFGVAVIMLGLIGGEYVGAALDSVYASAWWELAMIIVLPFYYWSQQIETFDDVKSRLSLFTNFFALGLLLGHVFPLRIFNSVPVAHVCLPFLDFLSVYGTRTKLVGAATIVTFVVTYTLMHLMCCLGFFAIVFILIHSALLYGHFSQSDPRLRIWWNAYSAFGTAIGPIVYVNYGTDEDYTLLEEANIDLKGKIALLRYGGVFRGDKALLAEKRGAIGVIIYSDPYDYAPELHQTNKIFPDQIWLPPSGAQRGTLLRTTGDPETPFYPSKPYVYRTEQEEYLRKRNVLSSIPVLPIGYRDAVKIMAKLNGPEVQWNRWKGSMNTTYRVTGTTSFRLEVRGRTSRRPIKNVIAIFRGKEESDRWVMLGNHVDAWTKGAIDPNSGTGILLETARVVKEIHDKTGWRPRRSLVFCQWDAEEFGLIGSTEWVEEMLKPLQTHAVAYLNLDNVNGNNTLAVKSVPLLYRVLVDAASKIQHPNPFEINHGRNTLLDAWRFYNPKGPLPGDKSIPAINIPGSGSDFQRFISYAGVPIADLKMESQPVYSYMLYHTMYELPWTVENLVDPTGHVFESMGKFWLEVARNLADSLIIPFDIVDYAVMLEEFFKKMDTQLVYLGINQALSHEFYQEKMQYLHGAIERFQVAAIEIQNIVHAVNTAERSISLRQAEMLNSRLLTVEKAFILEKGIYSERSFFRHAVFSVSEHDIYSGVTFALIMDPAAEYENAKGNETIQEHWLETIKLGFMKLTYAIESATVVLDLNGF